MRKIPVLALALLLAGCSVFEPFHTPGESDNVEDLISDARAAADEGHHQKAFTIMDKAMGIAPGDPRVRYLHAVTAVRAHDVDMLDVLDILQPADRGFPVDAVGKRVLLMSDVELENMYAAFRIVSADLEPLMREIIEEGRELSRLRESDDVLLSYGVSETLLGMLRVLDNDETEREFSLDERLIITKTPYAFDIRMEDVLLTRQEQDDIVDTAIERSWDHFVRGRHAFYCYYQFVTHEVIWTGGVGEPPSPLPGPTGDSVSGEMVEFVDDGVMALYNEKEDRQVTP